MRNLLVHPIDDQDRLEVLTRIRERLNQAFRLTCYSSVT
jgi:hypothetical protein